MAIVLDESARMAIAWRHARGQEVRVYVHLERGSLKAGAPWIVAAGWLPRTCPDEGFVLEQADKVEVYVQPRIARYAQARDLVISGAGLWHWRWLVMADPYMFEHMREWEQTHPEVPLHRADTGSSARRVRGADLADVPKGAPPLPALVGKTPVSGARHVESRISVRSRIWNRLKVVSMATVRPRARRHGGGA